MKKTFVIHTIKASSLLLAFMLFSSCEKDTGELGQDMIEGEGISGGKRINTKIVSYTIAQDSIQVSNPRPRRFLLGSTQSNDFGTAESTVYTQLRLESLSPQFPAGTTIDSVNLTLEYSALRYSVVPSGNTPITVDVHQLDEELLCSEIYYSNHVIPATNLLGTVTKTVDHSQMINVGDTTINALSIPLEVPFFEDLLFNPTGNSISDLDGFQAFFKGIRVRMTGANTIYYFRSMSNQTAIRIYYTTPDSVVGQFKILAGSNNCFFSGHEHDLSNAEANPQQQDTEEGEEKIYLSGMGGPVPILEFPELETYKDSLLMINKFQIRIPIVTGSRANYPAPESILAVYFDEENNRFLVPDYISEPYSERNGYLIRGEMRNGYYELILTRFLSRSIKEDRPLRIALIPEIANENATQVILAGNKNVLLDIETIMYFSK